jgi:hypothetical protein
LADLNFIVKNGLTVNGAFTANSSAVNASIITATSVNAVTLYVGGVSVNTMISGNAATAYANAQANAASLAATAYANAQANAASLATTAYTNAAALATAAYANAVANSAALYQTTAGLSANVLTLSSNLAIYHGNSSGTIANVASWITGNAAIAYSNAVANSAALYAPKNIPTFTGLMTAANITATYIGVNKSANSTYVLDANGDIRACRSGLNAGVVYLGSGSAYWYFDGTNMTTPVNCYAPNFVISSDARLKENVAPIFSTSLLVDSIEPKTFDFITGSKNEIGFIAQEVQEYIPEAIGSTADGYLAIKQSAMLAVLWEALRETRAELAQLKLKVG